MKYDEFYKKLIYLRVRFNALSLKQKKLTIRQQKREKIIVLIAQKKMPLYVKYSVK